MLFGPFLLLALCCSLARAAAALGFAPLSDALLLAAPVYLVWEQRRKHRHRADYLRGRRRPRSLRPRRQAPVLDGQSLAWGAEVLPAEVAPTHFLAAGTTGAGKTLLLNRLMQSVLPTLGKKRPDGTPFDRRALVYDAKSDVLGTLHALSGCRIVTLNPFDARGAAWDIARDISTPAAALQAATLLVPLDRTGSGNPFFVLAAQNLVRGVLLSFIQTAGGEWTFRDLLLALRFEDRLRQVLQKTQDGRAILDQFFQVGDTLCGVRATLATKLAPFEVIAAAWDKATERVSLREFLDGEFILVLGNDETTRTALDCLNRLLFQRLTELILAGPETRTRQTWLFLDEVREAGRLDGLSRLMTKGRSKGACVALGFQAIEGMWELYGKNIADEITGLCNHKALLRVESSVTAQWASELFGKTEELDRRESLSRSRSGRGFLPVWGRGRTLSEQRLTVDAVLASEVMTLPPTGIEHGFSGFFLTRSGGACRQSLSWETVQSWVVPAAAGVPNLVPRPDTDQYLREWTQDELDRLDLKPLRLVSEAVDADAGVKPAGRRLRPVRGR